MCLGCLWTFPSHHECLFPRLCGPQVATTGLQSLLLRISTPVCHVCPAPVPPASHPCAPRWTLYSYVPGLRCIHLHSVEALLEHVCKNQPLLGLRVSTTFSEEHSDAPCRLASSVSLQSGHTFGKTYQSHVASSSLQKKSPPHASTSHMGAPRHWTHDPSSFFALFSLLIGTWMIPVFLLLNICTRVKQKQNPIKDSHVCVCVQVLGMLWSATGSWRPTWRWSPRMWRAGPSGCPLHTQINW